MSKNPKPSPEELRFIYKLILKYGDDDKAILGEYAYLADMNRLKFPYRMDKRFVQERRREIRAAEEVLKQRIKRIDPVISKLKEEHFKKLSGTARSIVEGFARIRENPDSTDESNKYVLEILHDEVGGSPDEWPIESQILSVKELNERFLDHLRIRIGLYFTQEQFGYFTSHLEADYSLLKSKSIHEIANENSYELIRLITLLCHRGTFKGTCKVCESWYKE